MGHGTEKGIRVLDQYLAGAMHSPHSTRCMRDSTVTRNAGRFGGEWKNVGSGAPEAGISIEPRGQEVRVQLIGLQESEEKAGNTGPRLGSICRWCHGRP